MINNTDTKTKLRTCQPCALGDHERCQRTTTLGTAQLVWGKYAIDCCGCSCPQATVHRDGCASAAMNREIRGTR